uniref:ATP synthase 8 n=1 Tax=Bragasellus molinai TaxID=1281925 RepID=A0A485M913_9CRUS|nr:ATP synthase 8 [Bragasellus molinai]
MPQMSPIFWFALYFLFFIILMFISIKLFFISYNLFLYSNYDLKFQDDKWPW